MGLINDVHLTMVQQMTPTADNASVPYAGNTKVLHQVFDSLVAINASIIGHLHKVMLQNG